jgi:hypothetical protein
MAITVGSDGELKDNWLEEYLNHRKTIEQFCRDHCEDTDPTAVTNHLEEVEIDLSLDDQPLMQPGEDYDWRWRRDSVASLVKQTEWLIEFGDQARFKKAIYKLQELKGMLISLKKMIPNTT